MGSLSAIATVTVTCDTFHHWCKWLADTCCIVPHMLQDGSAPDVWLQLLERCAAEPDCQPQASTALRSLAQQLAEQRALTTQLRQHMSD
jgi:hypothetical protein